MQTRHGGDTRRPQTSCINDDLASDLAFIGDDRLNLSLRRKLDAGHARVGVDRHAHLLGKVHHRRGGDVRIELSITREINAAVKVLV